MGHYSEQYEEDRQRSAKREADGRKVYIERQGPKTRQKIGQADRLLKAFDKATQGLDFDLLYGRGAEERIKASIIASIFMPK